MAVSAAELSAGAALVAAGFSGTTLWLTGHRDERKWRREAMVETLVQFFAASFVGLSRQALSAREQGEDLEPFRNKYDAFHGTQMDALTRLRIIAPNNVISAAEKLHEADDAVRDSIFLSTVELSEEERRDLRRRRTEAREALLDAARKTLGLGKSHPIGALINSLPNS